MKQCIVLINGKVVDMPPGRAEFFRAPRPPKRGGSKKWTSVRRAEVLRSLIAYVEKYDRAPPTQSDLGKLVGLAFDATPWRLYNRWLDEEIDGPLCRLLRKT